MIRREMGVHKDWKPHVNAGCWVRGEKPERAFVGSAGGGKFFLTYAGRTVGRSFGSAEEAMKRGDEFFNDLDSHLRGNDELLRRGNDGQTTCGNDDQVIDIGMEVSGMAIEKPEETKRRIEMQTVDEAYALGRKHAAEDLAMSEANKTDYITIGELRGLDFARMTAEMAIYVKFYQVKKSKEYRKAGMTWEEFCGNAGKSVRRVDEILKDLSPVLQKIPAEFADFLGMPFNKIRYLGQSLLENSAEIAENALVIGGQKIELKIENREEIEAAIDVLKEERERELEKHTKEVERLKKRVENGVEEETKNLTVERDALVKELTRLKVFDPAEKDLTWSVQQMKEISKTGLLFVGLIQKFILDDRLDGEFELQAEVMKWQDICRNALDNLRHEWNERFINEFRSEP